MVIEETNTSKGGASSSSMRVCVDAQGIGITLQHLIGEPMAALIYETTMSDRSRDRRSCRTDYWQNVHREQLL